MHRGREKETSKGIKEKQGRQRSGEKVISTTGLLDLFRVFTLGRDPMGGKFLFFLFSFVFFFLDLVVTMEVCFRCCSQRRKGGGGGIQRLVEEGSEEMWCAVEIWAFGEE